MIRDNVKAMQDSYKENRIFDVGTSFESIKKSAIEGIQSAFPVEGKNQTLVLNKIWVDDNKASNDFSSQKDAKLKDKTFGVPVYGDISLIDNASGKEVDRKEKVKMTDLPKLTERGTFIVGGSEWNIPTQFRLKPGVYTVKQSNGIPKTQINLGSGGRGRKLEVHLDPEKNRMMLHVNSSTMPLYPVLRGLGVTHSQIEKKWGKDLAENNKDKYGSQKHQLTNMKKFADQYLDIKTNSIEEASIVIKDHLDNNTSLDPATTKITLNKSYEKFNVDALLDSSAKLKRVQNGEEGEDDRDHLRLKSVHSVDDVFRERFLSNRRQLHSRLRRAVDSRDKVRDVLAVPHIKKITEGTFSSLNISERSEQHNPVHIVNEANKTTLMGEGALGSLEMVKDEARSVHPSHLGVLDPIKTPESAKIGVVNYMTTSAKKIGNEITGLYKDPATGKEHRMNPGQSHEMHIALPDQFDMVKGKIKFRDNLVKVQYRGEISLVPQSKVDYVIPDAKDILSHAIAKAPFLNSMSGGRAFMASKHPEQALAIINNEQPLVQTDTGGGHTMEKELGRKFSAISPVTGKVTKIEDNAITITPSRGKSVTVPIYDNFKLNEKAFFNHTPNVKIGQNVKEDDIIADLNFTKDGELALGVNARVGYIVDSGKTLEDGFIVSESFAQKMTHQQYAEMTAPKGENFIYSKASYGTQFPGSMTSANAEKLDSRGIIKKGSKIEPGEIIFAIQRKQEDTSADRIFRKLGRGLSKTVKNFAITWNKDVPGEVIEVAETGKLYKAQIRITKALGVADKLCFDEEHEILTIEGWKNVQDISMDDKLATMNIETHKVSYHKPVRIHKYEHNGKMYRLESDNVSMCVTDNHKVPVNLKSHKDIQDLELKELNDCKGNPYRVQSSFGFNHLNPYKSYSSVNFDGIEDEWIDYMGYVHCVTVPNSTVYTRRNGKCHWSGNSGSYGNKGVVSEIRPDHLMPHNAAGEAIDIAFNPIGVVGRINPAQVFETVLGKVAEKTGKKQYVQNFKSKDNWDDLMKKLEKEGISPTEELFDENGKSLSQVKTFPIDHAWMATLAEDVAGFKKGHMLTKSDIKRLKAKGIQNVKIAEGTTTGRQYFHKLSKTAETGFSARSYGEGYDLNGQPVRGGEEGSKSMDQLTNWSMVAHGAKNIMREMATDKSEQNDEFWRAVQQGTPLPAPKVPFAWKKFEDMLRVGGIDVQKKGSLLQLNPTRDSDALNMSSGEIEDPKMLRGKGLKEHRGGLFDPILTGGVKGKKWTHINLAEPVANPIFKDPIKKLLDINDTTYRSLAVGKKYVDKEGVLLEGGHDEHASNPNHITGGAAIKKMLEKVDLKDARLRFESKAKKAKGSERNSANRALRYITALEKQDRRPEEAYTTQVLSVLPPVMRPIYKLPSGDLGVSPLNYLYRDVGMVNNQLKDAEWMDDDLKQTMRESLYQGMEAFTGINGSKSLTRPVKGVLNVISGDNPKTGYFQDKLLRKQQDLAARGVAIPNPDLHIDEVGIPKKMATKLFKPFMMEKMTKQYGLSMGDAMKRINSKKSDFLVDKALHEVMGERDVLINRAPSLHKYSIQSFRPKLVTGKALHTNTLIHKGFNLDHDGDALNVHVPVSPEALRESRNLRPSAILRSPARIGEDSIGNYMPMQMTQHGLWKMTKKDGKDTGINVNSAADVEDLLAKNEIDFNDLVKFKGESVGAGSIILNDVIPEEFRDYKNEFNKKKIKQLVYQMSAVNKKKAAHTLSQMQKVGDRASVNETVTMWDLRPVDDPRHKAAMNKLKVLSKDDSKDRSEKSQAMLKIVANEIVPLTNEFGVKNKSNYYNWLESGATGKNAAIIQQTSGPTIITDYAKNAIPVPVENSYSQGLSVSDYYNAQYGARGGMIGRALATAKPGYLNKLILASVGDSLILGNDCGDTEGIKMDISDPHAMDRFEVKTHRIVDSAYIGRLRDAGVSHVIVRSPVTCKNSNGICKMCYGPNEDGELNEEGLNIGAIAGQGMGEPLTQCFHPDTIVQIRKRNPVNVDHYQPILTMTMSEALEMLVPEFDREAEFAEYPLHDKERWEVFDHGHWTCLEGISRHRPTEDMMIVGNAKSMLVTQESHPVTVKTEGFRRHKDIPAKDIQKKVHRAFHDVALESSPRTRPELPPYFLGIFIADGSCWKKNDSYFISISSTPGEKSSFRWNVREKMIASLQKYHKGIISESEKEVKMFSKDLYLKCKDMRHHAHRKRLPSDFMQWNTSYTKKLLCGLIDGDACIKKNTSSKKGGDTSNYIMYTTVSFALAQQVAMICRRLDLYYSIGADKVPKLGNFHPFHICIRPTKSQLTSIFKESLRIGKSYKVYPFKRQSAFRSSPVTTLKKFDTSIEYVYDLTTRSQHFSAGMMRSHNSAMESFHCLHDHSIIQYKDAQGDVYHESIKDIYNRYRSSEWIDGDKTYSYPKEDLFFQDKEGWTKVEKLCRHLPDEDMIFISANGKSSIAQSSHPVMTKKEDGWQECAMSELKGKSIHTSYVNHGVAKESGFSATLDGYLIGFYLAEGCVKYQSSGSSEEKIPTTVTMSHCKSLSKIAMSISDRAMRSINESDIEESFKTYERCINIYGLDVAKEFLIFGRYAENKKLPRHFMSWSKEKLSKVLCGYIDGDGCIVKPSGKNTVGQIFCETTSYQLIQSMNMICGKMGIKSSVMQKPMRANSRFQPFCLVIKPSPENSHWLNDSVKVKEANLSWKSYYPSKTRLNLEDSSTVRVCKHSEYDKKRNKEKRQVYDVTTVSGTFIASGVYHHNSGGAIFAPEKQKSVAGSVSGFKRIQQLISMPQNLPLKTPIAKIDGTVNEIRKNPGGGSSVFVDSKEHNVGPGVPLTVQIGSKVKKGEALADGIIDPRDVLKVKGLRSTQKFLTNALYDAYGQKSLSKKNFEVVVRGLTNVGVVTDPGENSYLNYGDTVSLSQAEDIRRNPIAVMKAEDAVGFTLEGPQHGYMNGHEISAEDLLRLTGKDVKVKRNSFKFRSELYGVSQLPHVKNDWLAALGQERIQKTLMEGAATGSTSDIHGSSPVSSFAYGAEFGRGKNGKY